MFRLWHWRRGLLLAGMVLLVASSKAPAADEDLERLWVALGTDDPVQAEQAINSLSARPDRAVAWIRQKLRPAPSADDRQLSALLAALDSRRYREREKALHELQELGEVAEKFLHKALAQPLSLEVRRRVEGLLATSVRFHPPAFRLRASRAVEVLERIGDTGARNVLAALAQGAPEAQLTKEAKTALERLARLSTTSP
jgi:hypothetical protein